MSLCWFAGPLWLPIRIENIEGFSPYCVLNLGFLWTLTRIWCQPTILWNQLSSCHLQAEALLIFEFSAIWMVCCKNFDLLLLGWHGKYSTKLSQALNAEPTLSFKSTKSSYWLKVCACPEFYFWSMPLSLCWHLFPRSRLYDKNIIGMFTKIELLFGCFSRNMFSFSKLGNKKITITVSWTTVEHEFGACVFNGRNQNRSQQTRYHEAKRKEASRNRKWEIVVTTKQAFRS